MQEWLKGVNLKNQKFILKERQKKRKAMPIMAVIFSLIFLSLLSISSALPNDSDNKIDFTYDTSINYSLVPTVNSSEYWNTNIGTLDNANATQFENNGETLSIINSWLTSFFNSLFGTKTTDDLTEGSINLYDNQSWNETRADTIYATIDEPLWTANYTNLNDTWSSTYNASYDSHVNWTDGAGAIDDFRTTGTSTSNILKATSNGLIWADGTTGTTPVSGAGTRFMWIPAKSAIRAGKVTGTQWDDANIGLYSFASGLNPIASGQGSVAMTYNGEVTGAYAVAMGYRSDVSADFSVGMGRSPTVSETYSVGMGLFPTVTARSAVAMGSYLTAQSFSSAVFGRYNEISGATTNWIDTDPLFIIGNGASSVSRHNALTLLKNGNLGIGTSNPSELLEVNGNIYLQDNDKSLYGTGKNSSIYYDGVNLKIVANESGNGIVYVDTNISVENLIDRSWYWDKSLGNSLDFVKDTDELKNKKGKHDDTKLNEFEKATYMVVDFDRPVNESYKVWVCDEKEINCYNETRIKIIYPYRKMETGRLVSATIGKHEQNIYDLKQENNAFKSCLLSESTYQDYRICVGGKLI